MVRIHNYLRHDHAVYHIAETIPGPFLLIRNKALCLRTGANSEPFNIQQNVSDIFLYALNSRVFVQYRRSISASTIAQPGIEAE